MKVLDIRPEQPGMGNTLARFDIEFPGGVRMYNLKLATGGRVFAPSAFGASVATFPQHVVAALAAAAISKLGEITSDAARAN